MPVATKGKPLVQIVEEIPAVPAPAVTPVVSVIQTEAPVKVADKPVTDSVIVVKSDTPVKAEKTIEKEEKKVEKEEKKADKQIEKEEKKVVKEEKKLDKAIEKEEIKKQKTIIVVAPEPVHVTEAPKVVIPGKSIAMVRVPNLADCALAEPVKTKNNKPVEVYDFDMPMRRRDRMRRAIYGFWLKLSRRSRSRDGKFCCIIRIKSSL